MLHATRSGLRVRTWITGGSGARKKAKYFAIRISRELFRLLQKYGKDAFYKGEIARAIVKKSSGLGAMTLAETLRYAANGRRQSRPSITARRSSSCPRRRKALPRSKRSTFLPRVSRKLCRGNRWPRSVRQIPNIGICSSPRNKLRYRDLYRYDGDPDVVNVPVARLLSPEHAASICREVVPDHETKIAPPSDANGNGDTIVLSTADRWGNMVSWVNSNFDEFGSGLTVPGYGFILHDRGGLFSLNPRSPDAIAPHKRPTNTLMAGFTRATAGRCRRSG